MNIITKKDFVLVLMMITLVTSFIYSFNASELDTNSCFEYELSAPTNRVLEGYEIQFDLEYSTSDTDCSDTEIQGQKIEIDFSSVVNSGSDITYLLDNNVFDVDISSSGVVTLTFKDLSTTGQTLVSLGGNAVFSMPAKSVDGDQQVLISTNDGNQVIVDIVDNVRNNANTNKSSFSNYVKVGDTITYQVLINNHENTVTDFHGVDSHSPGLEYIDGSFYAQQDQVWVEMSDYFTNSYDLDGQMIIDNTKPFDVPVLLTYDMTVTDPAAIYHNQFDAYYNQEDPDIVGYDVWYGLDDDSWINYSDGTITITKQDQQGKPLSGAEFDVTDSEGNIVEHLTTDSNGHAESSRLKLGNYTIAETDAPEGYKLDSSQYDVKLTTEQRTANVQSVGEIIDDSQNYIHIRLMNEMNQGLANVSFGIYDSNGNLIDTIVTDKDGNATSKYLKPGKYYLQQLDTVNGYLLNSQKYWFEIGGSNVDLEYKIVNHRITGSLQVGAVDDQNRYLSGTEFAVYKSNGDLIETLSTGESGVQSLNNLEYGSYYLIQTKTADGYISNQQRYYFNIENQGDVVTLKIPNSQSLTLDQPEAEISVVSNLNNQKLVTTGSSTSSITIGLLFAIGSLFSLKRYVTK